MNFQATIRLSPDVLTQQVGEELVLLDLNGEAYFGLDPVGARIWQLLEQGNSLDAVARQLLEEYEVEESRLRADIQYLVDELLAQGLATLDS